ncbi:hypothetical protein PsorP6_003764 [Peronosclerospora sorghi]|uniref:Uncharacterized protein n=1 Tax=Peronosclerospora sorghi TaxID=230839 RepID=A0ACC0VKC8_9STRA|nr:hypothetical protein PsorP6_003764 [Peronosclerospora sorghi]
MEIEKIKKKKEHRSMQYPPEGDARNQKSKTEDNTMDNERTNGEINGTANDLIHSYKSKYLENGSSHGFTGSAQHLLDESEEAEVYHISWMEIMGANLLLISDIRLVHGEIPVETVISLRAATGDSHLVN